MGKAVELVMLGKRSLSLNRVKAPGSRLLQPDERIRREGIPQQGYTLLAQLRRSIIRRHTVSVAETG